MKFINLCDSLNILLLILPPYITHRLQFLDVSLFGSLANFYTQNLNTILFNSLGIRTMTKRAFWSLFWPTWKEAFTLENIISVFRSTGIFFHDLNRVLKKIIKKQPVEDSELLRTLIISRAVRRVYHVYKTKPTKFLLSKIFHANECLAAEQSISQHIIQRQEVALKQEKKRRKRGQRLNLLGEEDSGAQLWSPTKVEAARTYQATKEEEDRLKKEGIESRKVEKAARKEQKEKEKAEKAAATAERRRLAA